MNAQETALKKNPLQNHRAAWPVFFLLGCVQSLAALTWLGLIPGDPKNGLLFGFSASRLVLMVGVLILALGFTVAAIAALRSEKTRGMLSRLKTSKQAYGAVSLALIVILIAAWAILIAYRSEPGEANFAIFERLTPVLTLLAVFSLEGLIWSLVYRFGLHSNQLGEYRPAAKIGLLGLAGVGILALIVEFTGFGVSPDAFFWGSPGVPLLSWQVFGSALLAVLAFVLFKFVRPLTWKTDLALFLILWVGAYSIWMSQPIQRSFFTPGPRAPNFEFYPYSDAGFYDYVAQSILTGSGFLNHQIVTRPLYAVILAGFHALAGQDYTGMIALQTILLALFPALLYLLGMALHSREVGILTASLAIWRELNLLRATPLTEVSNSKMLLTDSLTGVAFAGLILWLIWWQKRKPASLTTALWIGGFFGLMLLLRAQALVVFPVIVALILLNQRKNFKTGLATAGMMIVGAALAFSPWLVRNYQLTGQIVFDQPSQAALTAVRFTTEDVTNDALLKKPSQEVSAEVVRFIAENPLFTARFMLAHFLNNEFSTLTMLPMNFSPVDPRDNLYVETPFWLQGLKGLSLAQAACLIINVLLLVAGVAFAVSKFGWMGWMPLFIHLAYAFSSAMARISGWRFVQPVDWIGYLYYAMGLACAFGLVLSVLRLNTRAASVLPPDSGPTDSMKSVWGKLAAAAVVIVILGSITPAMETIIPSRYPVTDKSMLLQKMATEPALMEDSNLVENLGAMAGNPNAAALWGRALYPRFYKAGQGEPGSGWAAYKARDFAHLGFVLITPDGMRQVILPLEKPPAAFPSGSDVLIAGCGSGTTIQAGIVLVGSDDNALYLSSQPSPFECK